MTCLSHSGMWTGCRLCEAAKMCFMHCRDYSHYLASFSIGLVEEDKDCLASQEFQSHFKRTLLVRGKDCSLGLRDFSSHQLFDKHLATRWSCFYPGIINTGSKASLSLDIQWCFPNGDKKIEKTKYPFNVVTTLWSYKCATTRDTLFYLSGDRFFTSSANV